MRRIFPIIFNCCIVVARMPSLQRILRPEYNSDHFAAKMFAFVLDRNGNTLMIEVDDPGAIRLTDIS